MNPLTLDQVLATPAASQLAELPSEALSHLKNDADGHLTAARTLTTGKPGFRLALIKE